MRYVLGAYALLFVTVLLPAALLLAAWASGVQAQAFTSPLSPLPEPVRSYLPDYHRSYVRGAYDACLELVGVACVSRTEPFLWHYVPAQADPRIDLLTDNYRLGWLGYCMGYTGLSNAECVRRMP